MPQEEFKVPVIPETPDDAKTNEGYHSALKNALLDSEKWIDFQLVSLKNLSEEMYGELISKLKAKGLKVNEGPEQKKEVSVEDIIFGYRVRKITIPAADTSARRRIKDIVTIVNRECQDRKRTLDDKLIASERAHEDALEKIYDLTTTSALNEIDPNHNAFHFYILTKDGAVYETHFNLNKNTFDGPSRNPGLKASEFSDARFLADFKKQCEGIKANAYVVTNPLGEVLSVSDLSIDAYVKVGVNILFQRMEQQISDYSKKSPVERAAESLRKATDCKDTGA